MNGIFGEIWMSPQLPIRYLDADMITRGQRAKKDSTPKKDHRSSGVGASPLDEEGI